jgi:uncharacterized protein YukE
LAESNRLVVEMLRRHDDSFDELRAAQAATEHKIAALVDARIRNEGAHARGTEEPRASTRELQVGMQELRAALSELAGVVRQLAESQAHTDRRLDGLIDIVRDSRNGRGGDAS